MKQRRLNRALRFTLRITIPSGGMLPCGAETGRSSHALRSEVGKQEITKYNTAHAVARRHRFRHPNELRLLGWTSRIEEPRSECRKRRGAVDKQMHTI